MSLQEKTISDDPSFCFIEYTNYIRNFKIKTKVRFSKETETYVQANKSNGSRTPLGVQLHEGCEGGDIHKRP